MARSRPSEFNAAQDTGRMGFRRDYEPVDDRPLLIDPYPFWADETERMTYEAAVEANPKRADEGPMAYVQRISAAVTGKYQALGKRMPRRQSRAERDRQLARLRAQGRGMGDGWEDYEVVI